MRILIVDDDPADTAAKYFLSKAAHYISLGTLEEWTGVEGMAGK